MIVTTSYIFKTWLLHDYLQHLCALSSLKHITSQTVQSNRIKSIYYHKCEVSGRQWSIQGREVLLKSLVFFVLLWLLSVLWWIILKILKQLLNNNQLAQILHYRIINLNTVNISFVSNTFFYTFIQAKIFIFLNLTQNTFNNFFSQNIVKG